MPACSAASPFGDQIGGEDRRQHEQARDDAGVPGRDRPTAVDRLRRPALQGRLRQRREHQRQADADQDLRGERGDDQRPRKQSQAGEPSGHQDRPGRRASAGIRYGPGQRAGASAASGITDTARAATIGDCLQPSIKSRTIKKSAAASAAETSPRARFGGEVRPARLANLVAS